MARRSRSRPPADADISAVMSALSRRQSKATRVEAGRKAMDGRGLTAEQRREAARAAARARWGDRKPEPTAPAPASAAAPEPDPAAELADAHAAGRLSTADYLAALGKLRKP